MNKKSQEKGQALILVALAAVGLFGFTALAIDGSRVFSDRRHGQNAADTAALAAALSKIRADPPETGDAVAEAAGLARAASNGFDHTNSIVEVNNCAEPNLDPPCVGIPAGSDPEEYIQVVIHLTTKTTFARVLGWTEVPSIVSAIARAEPGGLGPVGDGAALSAMSPDDEDAIFGHGNFNLDIINSGIFDNSNHNCAFTTSGSAGTYSVDTAFEVVGGHCQNGFPSLDGPLQDASQIPYPPRVDVLAPTITCSGNSVYDAENRTYSPGNHTNLNIPNGTVTFAPGNHCFDGGVSVSGNTNIIAFNANFLISSGEFRLNTNGTFTCNNLLVHIDGGTGFRVNGNSTNTCEGVTFYASTGDVSWNGNPTIDFKAPTFGPYQGLLIYLPYGNTSPLTINGNSQQSLTGSIIAVSSPIQINGNSGTFALRSEIIGYTVSLAGNGNFVMDYDPDDMFQQIDPTLIQMTK
ncbi:MAG TPA: pilus assembly protein TadG-related protein [Anaerolineales bacterium]|nr:pilus assembly protein TadG-related protein [Anaerolineales bacterium]